MIPPHTIVHADWGKDPRKRWQVRADLRADGRYVIDQPQRVGDTADWLTRMQSPTGPTLVGVDFAIGLPLAYADQVGVTDFSALLPELGQGRWADFYHVATQAAEIGLQRPFYPYRPGGTRQQHLLDALNVSSINDLRRICDRGTATRRPAAPLFWTMGAQQVGKAAISGWRDVLAPALRDRSDVALWPFAGSLSERLQPGRIVVAESYPAEFYGYLGLSFAPVPNGHGGKRIQAGRRANASPLLAWTDQRPVVFSPALREVIANGFGARAAGEDPFDALVGLLGMLDVVLGYRPSGEPNDTRVRQVEGWILGQAPETTPDAG